VTAGPALPGSGAGLLGLQERVEIADGTLVPVARTRAGPVLGRDLRPCVAVAQRSQAGS